MTYFWCLLLGRGYLPEPFRQIRTYLPEPVPANKDLFAGTFPVDSPSIFDPRKGFFGQKKWPLAILVFQFGGYNNIIFYWSGLCNFWTTGSIDFDESMFCGLIVRTQLNSKLNTASKKFNGVVFDRKMGLHIFFEEVTNMHLPDR